jgi:uncharacterized protein (TIRG00374 family)
MQEKALPSTVPASAAAPKARRRAPLLYSALGLVISAVCLFLVFRGVNWTTFLATIAGVQLGWLGVGIALNVGVYLALALRWWALLLAVQPTAVTDMIDFSMIGLLAGLLLPMRLGDLGKSVLLGRYTGASSAVILGSVLVERFLDVLAMVTLGALLTFVMPVPPAIQTAVASLAAVMIAAAVALVALVRFKAALLRLFDRLTGWLPHRLTGTFRAVLVRLIDGLGCIHSPRQLLLVIVSTFLIWGLSIAMQFMYMRAFEIATPWAAAALVTLAINLGGLIPASPGGVGIYQYLVQFALSVWNVDASRSLGYAVVSNILVIIVVTILGAISLSRKNLSLRKLQPPPIKPASEP